MFNSYILGLLIVYIPFPRTYILGWGDRYVITWVR